MNEDQLGNFKKIYRMDLERSYVSDVEKVWDAITISEKVSAWMEYKIDVDLKIGGSYTVNFGREGIINGVICTLKPLEEITFTWGDSLIKWTFEYDGKITKTIFSHIGLTKDNMFELGAGWHAFIDYLEPYLQNKALPRNRHEMLMSRYKNEIKL